MRKAWGGQAFLNSLNCSTGTTWDRNIRAGPGFKRSWKTRTSPRMLTHVIHQKPSWKQLQTNGWRVHQLLKWHWTICRLHLVWVYFIGCYVFCFLLTWLFFASHFFNFFSFLQLSTFNSNSTSSIPRLQTLGLPSMMSHLSTHPQVSKSDPNLCFSMGSLLRSSCAALRSEGCAWQL